MILNDTEFTDIKTPTGAMRVHVFRPAGAGKYPGIVMYSEIFQITGPIQRMAALLAGHGYVVACPEIFHEFEAAGTVLAYDPAGTERGNAHKTAKAISAYDGDCLAVLDFLRGLECCSGQLGAIGFCIGGHLAFRAAMNPGVQATACFYATDIHKRSLGLGMSDDSLDRVGDIKGALLHIWGKQDPHIPPEGRALIKAKLAEKGTKVLWHEFDALHAFMRDEGPRYDPALALQCWSIVLEFFRQNLITPGQRAE